MSSKLEIPKKKPNHFFILDRKENKYDEVKYLNQHELSEGWYQVIPNYNNHKLINHYSVTLAFLPEHLWSKLHKLNDSYKVIKNGITRYTLIETNQDQTMFELYDELKNRSPNKTKLMNYITNLDTSQHNSWLVQRAKYYINNSTLYPEEIIKFE